MIRVERYNLYYSNIPLKKPFITALRRVESAESIVVELICTDGIVGYGAASPTAAITGDTLGSIAYALDKMLLPSIVGKELKCDLLGTVGVGLLHNSGAKSALDIAIYDALSKAAGLPLFRYLGGVKRSFVNDLTISIGSPERMAHDAVEAAATGVGALKLKLVGDGRDDERINAVSEAVPSVELRLDPNQSWTLDEAKRVLGSCKNARITLVEQPFHFSDRINGGILKKCVSIPIMADESVFSPEDAETVLSGGEADIVNIKLAKSGGIYPSLKINEAAKRHGGKCLVGCMLENPIATAAAAHFALACDNCVGVDLDVPCLLEYDPVLSNVSFENGVVSLRDEDAGLGIKELGRLSMIAESFGGGERN